MDRDTAEREDYADRDLPPAPTWADELSPIIAVFASFGVMTGAIFLIGLLAGRGSH
jgi:hypothetical protein